MSSLIKLISKLKSHRKKKIKCVICKNQIKDGEKITKCYSNYVNKLIFKKNSEIDKYSLYYHTSCYEPKSRIDFRFNEIKLGKLFQKKMKRNRRKRKRSKKKKVQNQDLKRFQI